MIIYTSYFSQIKNLPNNIVPIAICVSTPYWYSGIEYKPLAPSYDILNQYKRVHDEINYTRRYIQEIINPLDADSVYDDLYRLSNGNDVALLCYEKSGDFCHRNIDRRWFNYNKITSVEFKKNQKILCVWAKNKERSN